MIIVLQKLNLITVRELEGIAGVAVFITHFFLWWTVSIKPGLLNYSTILKLVVFSYNIIWRDIERKNVVKNVDRSSFQVHKMARTKNNQTKKIKCLYLVKNHFFRWISCDFISSKNCYLDSSSSIEHLNLELLSSSVQWYLIMFKIKEAGHYVEVIKIITEI